MTKTEQRRRFEELSRELVKSKRPSANLIDGVADWVNAALLQLDQAGLELVRAALADEDADLRVVVTMREGFIILEASKDNRRCEIFRETLGAGAMHPENRGDHNPMSTVRNGPNLGYRLSALQREILSFLATKGKPMGDLVGHLPRTGDIVDAVGRPRNNAGFASVSRALARLEEQGFVASYQPSVGTARNGRHYWASLAGSKAGTKA